MKKLNYDKKEDFSKKTYQKHESIQSLKKKEKYEKVAMLLVSLTVNHTSTIGECATMHNDAGSVLMLGFIFSTNDLQVCLFYFWKLLRLTYILILSVQMNNKIKMIA